MKKLFLNKAVLALGTVVLLQQNAAAQNPPLQGGQIGSGLVEARFMVNAPAAISGLKKITLADWGNQVASPFNNVQVVKGLDTLGANTLTNSAAINGKFCLLFRGGGISFVDKATRAQAAGATGLIIVNNIPGDPIAMGGTTSAITIPVVMVSDVDGNAINNQLRNSVAVNVTLGKWSLGATHDLGILNAYAAMPHAINIPSFMWSNSTTAFPYKNYVGGAIFNFGTSTETGVTVTDSIWWNPTSGGSSFAKTNTYTVGTIAPIDSVKFGFGAPGSSYYLTPQAGTGRYDYKSRIVYGNTDGVPADNINTFSQYITDSIFCKGRYDFAKGEPIVNIGIRPNQSNTPYMWGPMYFSTRGGYAARSVQFYMSVNNDPTLVNREVSALVFKWVDGMPPNGIVDSLVASDELTLVGIGSRTFTTNDSSGRSFYVNIEDATTPGKPLILDSNAWYWTSLQAPFDCFIGMDRGTSYFTRAYIQSQTGSHDYPEAIFVGDFSTLLTSNPPIAIANFPFGGNPGNIDSTFFDQYNEIPNVALHMSKNKVPTGITSVKNDIGSMTVFPNPAVGGVFNVDVTLNKNTDRLSYRLFDATGRIIKDVAHYNVKTDKFQYPVSGLPAGNYYLIANDGKGAILRKIVIQ